MASTRKTHNKILEAIAEGTLTPQMVAEACLAYMSEAEIADMAHDNSFFEYEEEEQEEAEEYPEDYEDPHLTYERERGEASQDRMDMWRREQ